MRHWLLLTLALVGAAFAASPARIEARSATLLAVGVVQGERMVIHVSRLEDNAPLKDALVAVTLRGVVHATTAEADGSYSFSAKELALPGAAAVQFAISAQDLHETLKGTLDVAAPAGAAKDDGGARQYGWWVLNFAVCIAFLWLFSRRKKAAD